MKKTLFLTSLFLGLMMSNAFAGQVVSVDDLRADVANLIPSFASGGENHCYFGMMDRGSDLILRVNHTAIVVKDGIRIVRSSNRSGGTVYQIGRDVTLTLTNAEGGFVSVDLERGPVTASCEVDF